MILRKNNFKKTEIDKNIRRRNKKSETTMSNMQRNMKHWTKKYHVMQCGFNRQTIIK